MTGGPPLGRHEYELRLEELAVAFQGRYGEVTYGYTESASGTSRKLLLTVTVPGWGLPTEATLAFAGKHAWDRRHWVPYAYAYDLHVEPKPNGRFAYHWDRDVFHVHCEGPARPARGHHFRGAPVDDIFWAAESLFEILHHGISCRGLQPLTGREETR